MIAVALAPIDTEIAKAFEAYVYFFLQHKQ